MQDETAIDTNLDTYLGRLPPFTNARSEITDIHTRTAIEIIRIDRTTCTILVDPQNPIEKLYIRNRHGVTAELHLKTDCVVNATIQRPSGPLVFNEIRSRPDGGMSDIGKPLTKALQKNPYPSDRTYKDHGWEDRVSRFRDQFKPRGK
jgi:hypothetical protein